MVYELDNLHSLRNGVECRALGWAFPSCNSRCSYVYDNSNFWIYICKLQLYLNLRFKNCLNLVAYERLWLTRFWRHKNSFFNFHSWTFE